MSAMFRMAETAHRFPRRQFRPAKPVFDKTDLFRGSTGQVTCNVDKHVSGPILRDEVVTGRGGQIPGPSMLHISRVVVFVVATIKTRMTADAETGTPLFHVQDRGNIKSVGCTSC